MSTQHHIHSLMVWTCQPGFIYTAPTMLPFRELLLSGSQFYWDSRLEDLFNQSEQRIIKDIEEGVQIFDKKRPTMS